MTVGTSSTNARSWMKTRQVDQMTMKLSGLFHFYAPPPPPPPWMTKFSEHDGVMHLSLSTGTPPTWGNPGATRGFRYHFFSKVPWLKSNSPPQGLNYIWLRGAHSCENCACTGSHQISPWYVQIPPSQGV